MVEVSVFSNTYMLCLTESGGNKKEIFWWNNCFMASDLPRHQLSNTFNMHVAGGGVGVCFGGVVARHRHLDRLDDQLVLLSVAHNLDTARRDDKPAVSRSKCGDAS